MVANQSVLRPSALMQGVNPEMYKADFWINKLVEPDKTILNTKQIEALNRRIATADETVNLWEEKPGTIEGNLIRRQIETNLKSINEQKLTLKNGKAFDAQYIAKLRRETNLDAIPALINPRFAVLTGFASQRLLPSRDALITTGGESSFDRLQNSAYEIGTPHIVYHESTDGKWIYAQSSTYSGWYPTEVLAFCSYDEWVIYHKPSKFIVITSPKAMIYSNPATTEAHEFIRMGNTLPLLVETGDFFEIQVPKRNPKGSLFQSKGYIKKTDANLGYLTYSSQNVLNIAFKMINQAYGWGDQNADWDCSSFVKAVYGVFGIHLPRDGGNQENAGSKIISYTKENSIQREKSLIQKATAGISLVRMPGHIMFYIGSHDNKAFVLHNVYAYREKPAGGNEKTVLINRTVVSTLDPGVGTRRGSWLARLTSVVDIR